MSLNNNISNWLEYQKTIIDSICTLKNETNRITQFHIDQHKGRWPPEDQILKIIEEAMEIKNAWKNNDVENEREEYIDLIMAVLTLLHLEEVTDEEIKIGVTKVLNKFVERGWLKPHV